MPGAWEQRRKLGSKPVRGLAHKLYYIFGPEHALPRQGLGFRFGWDGRAQEKQFVRPASPQKRQPPDDSIFNCIFDEGLSDFFCDDPDLLHATDPLKSIQTDRFCNSQGSFFEGAHTSLEFLFEFYPVSIPRQKDPRTACFKSERRRSPRGVAEGVSPRELAKGGVAEGGVSPREGSPRGEPRGASPREVSPRGEVAGRRECGSRVHGHGDRGADPVVRMMWYGGSCRIVSCRDVWRCLKNIWDIFKNMRRVRR